MVHTVWSCERIPVQTLESYKVINGISFSGRTGKSLEFRPCMRTQRSRLQLARRLNDLKAKLCQPKRHSNRAARTGSNRPDLATQVDSCKVQIKPVRSKYKVINEAAGLWFKTSGRKDKINYWTAFHIKQLLASASKINFANPASVHCWTQRSGNESDSISQTLHETHMMRVNRTVQSDRPVSVRTRLALKTLTSDNSQ